MSNSPVDFLRRELEVGWIEERSATLTMPVYDGEAATMTGGGYRHDGSLILQTLRPARLGHWRHIDPVSVAYGQFDDAPVFEAAILGGHFFNMWGHFLFETVTTALLGDTLPKWPVVFSPFAPDAPERFQSVWNSFKPLLVAAGWGDRDLFLQTETTKFNRLIIPERLAVFGLPNQALSIVGSAAEAFARIRRAFGSAVGIPRPMVARRPDWTWRMHPVEGELYALLEASGYLVVDVVALTPIQQVEIFSNASALVGFCGSNLHNSVFCPQGTKVLEIGDLRSYNAEPGDRINPTQTALCRLLDQPTFFIDGFDKTDGGELAPISAAEIGASIDAIVRG
jgi:hypothetical protein